MLQRKRLVRILGFAVLVMAIYFINVEVQTWLGKRALEASGLERHSLVEALTLARADSKLVLADMSAIWCASCRRLDQKVFSDPEVQEAIAKDYVFARVEYESDKGKAFQERYNVKAYPTVLVLDADGRLVRQLRITFDPVEFRGQL